MYNVDVGTPGKVLFVTASNTVSSGSGTSASSITATFSASAASAASSVGYKFAITHFSGASSVSGDYTIESPAGTVLWRKTMTGANHHFSENFDPPIITASSVNAVVLKGNNYAATNTGTINAGGFQLYNTG